MVLLGILFSLFLHARGHPLVDVDAPNACPKLITRAEWGARPPKAFLPMQSPVPYTVIHHSVMSACSTYETCKTSLKEIQDFHMDTNGWDDIGYSFLVGGDGNVYEGRGWNRVGAHAPNYNDKSIGICVIGDFTDSLPNKAQLDNTKALIQCGVKNNYINSTYVLLGHRDVRDTECPGETFYQEILTWPHKGLPPTKN